MRATEFLKEAGISRRGFLKGIAGAAAQAAAPGGVANLAKASVPAVASTMTPAVTASQLPALFAASLGYGLDQGWSDSLEPDDAEPNPELMEPQGDEGELPWGEAYELRVTPRGREYIAASSPYGSSAVFTFIKNGQPRNIEIAWERDGYGEVYGSEDEKDADAYYDYTDDHGDLTQENEGSVIDAIIDNYAGGGNQDVKQNVKQNTTSTGTAPADLARLAGVAKKGIDALTPAQAADQDTAQPSTQKPVPASLPAPGKADVLEPELDKQKQQVPVNKKV